jgi:hypothetical protein
VAAGRRRMAVGSPASLREVGQAAPEKIGSAARSLGGDGDVKAVVAHRRDCDVLALKQQARAPLQVKISLVADTICSYRVVEFKDQGDAPV